MRRIFTLPVVVSLVVAATVRPAIPQTPVHEAVEVRAVEVLMLARDATDSPVEDLQPSDLRVAWKGEPRMFRLSKLSETLPSATEVPQVRLGLQIGSEETVVSPSREAPRHFVFFIDLTADLQQKPAAAAEPLVQFVRESLLPQDLAAVAVYNGNLSFETGFESDPAAIEEAVRRAYARPRASASNTRQRIRSLIASIERCELLTSDSVVLSAEEERMQRASAFGALSAEPNCVRALADAYIEEGSNRAEIYFRALEQAIRFSGGIRGGITLIALSHGVSLEPEREFAEVALGSLGTGQFNVIRGTMPTNEKARDALARVQRLATNERVTIYTVDSARLPRGVKSAGQASLALDASSPMELAFQLPTAPLAELAESTVGAYLHEDDPLTGLRKVLDLDRGRYRVLVYLPDGEDPAARSKLTIKPAEKGIRLTFNTRFSVGERENVIPAQLAFGPARPLSTDELTDVYLPFTLGARPDDLDYQLVGSNRVADLSLHIRVDEPSGSHVVSTYRAFRHTLPAARWDEQKGQLLGIRGWIQAPPGRYAMSAVFRNAATGREGLVRRDVRVEAAPDP